ncbi:DUF7311 family protein [Halorubrum vacuolatum]|uniref:DUF7311 domain-containing protein n=1 Tax=Halorubrum vacuolatum TaxID=63740 RepID=A0A238X499_HALVU|nr:hypothetical protein [Halorubrum vacuolatum]SNR53413.1 hypothetical protein SAMN06264855_11325 [Halorubrum vacuolatum]
MIRAVLAVLVAVALLAVTAPALETARTDTTAERLNVEAERLERHAGALTADAVAVDDPTLAARKTVTVRVPSGFTTAPIERVVIGTPETIPGVATDDERDVTGPSDMTGTTADIVFVYQFTGAEPEAIPITTPTGAELDVIDGPIHLRHGGETRVRLSLIDDGEPTVRLTRVG